MRNWPISPSSFIFVAAAVVGTPLSSHATQVAKPSLSPNAPSSAVDAVYTDGDTDHVHKPTALRALGWLLPVSDSSCSPPLRIRDI